MIADDATLTQLMVRAQAGDAAAYRVVLVECRRWLMRYFTRRIAPSAIDDLVQETLVSLHAKRATYDPARPFLPWLAAIARYRWIDQLRRNYRAAEVELDDIAADDTEEETIMARIGLDRLLARLPERQAAVIRLVKIEGLSIAEASETTGQSQPLVKVNIHRGIRKLAAYIESE